MDSNSYVAYTNSSSSSSSSSHEFLVYSEEEKRSVRAPAPSFHSSLHAVRKLPAKPIMKKPIAPLPPTKPKVYKVDPSKFKEVVQRLTAAPEFQRRRLEQMAPPALDLSTTTRAPLQHLAAINYNAGIGRPELITSPMKAPVSASFAEAIPVERKSHKFSETCGALSPLGFSFSPSAMAWPFSPLLSPGTLSSLEQSTVLY